MYKTENGYNITLLLQRQLFVFILLVYFISKYYFIFMFICIDNIAIVKKY